MESHGDRDTIRYVTRSRRKVNPTSRLPPEVLAIIFSEIKHEVEQFPKNAKQAKRGTHMLWIRTISHVCSRWRDVALDINNLWTNIPLGNPKWCRAMLLRSKAATLTISFNASLYRPSILPESFSLLKEILQNHMSRIKTLSLESLPPSRNDIFGLLNQPAPILEILKVQTTDPTTSKVPPIILQTSRLQSLTLRKCGMDWDPQLSNLRDLRVLDIRNIPSESTPSFPRTKSSPTVEQLLTIFSTTPHLSELTIEDTSQLTSCVALIFRPPIFHSKSVKLDHLQKISIACDPLSCAFLLDHISIPRNTGGVHEFHMMCPVRDAIERLIRKLDESIDAPLVRLDLGPLAVRGWKSEDTTIIPRPNSQPTIIVTVRGYGQSSPQTVGRSICHSLDMKQLLALTVSLRIDEETWSMLSELPHLKELRVAKQESRFYTALRGKDDDDIKIVPSTFPALIDLTLVDWDLDTTVTVFDHTQMAIMEALTICLERRKKGGSPLSKIHIQKSREVDAKQLRRLRKVVDVDWDGKGEISQEHDENLRQ
ncbi:hypothetical protein H0H93_015392 [Arthromyces matolae]|nr:hypothetical protein H0H93_015392 [Arthromyces matolae]